jgi:radical SAM protein with 4Fe4S-binding SPASM domain
MKKKLVIFVAITIGLLALQPTQAQKSNAQKSNAQKSEAQKSQGQKAQPRPHPKMIHPMICDDCDPCPSCGGGCTSPNPIDNAQFFVEQHYRDFLGRDPALDPWGVAFWTGQITQCGSNSQCVADKRVDVSRAFWESSEFRQHSITFGLDNSNPPPQYDNREFVLLCYVIYLQRWPDQSGWDFWTNGLDNCTSDPNRNGSNGYQCYQDTIRAFLVSTEYRARFGCP